MSESAYEVRHGTWNREKFRAMSKYNMGKTSSEDFRMSTFTDWPRNNPMNPCELARAGFYYIGAKDAVKCFACNGALEDFEMGDDAMVEHRRFYPTCPFVTGQVDHRYHPHDDTTSSCDELKADETDCKESHTNHHSLLSTSPPHAPIDSQRYSKRLHVSGPPRRTWDGIGETGETPSKPNYDYPEKGWPMTVQSPSSTETRDRRTMYKSCGSRLNTFLDEDCPMRWRRGGPTPRALAEAGFIFTGPGDRCVCFFNGCSLERWVATDDPWLEHIRHFPTCSWVIRCRGQAFVNDVIQNNNHSLTSLTARVETLHVKGPSEKTRETKSSQSTRVLSPSSPSRKQTRSQSPLTSASTQHRQLASQSKLPPRQSTSSKSSSLRSSTRARSSSMTPADVRSDTSISSSTTQRKSVNTRSKIYKVNEKDDEIPAIGMTDPPRCELCHTGPLDTLFLPCRHLATCGICAATLDDCPLCAQPIIKYIYIFST